MRRLKIAWYVVKTPVLLIVTSALVILLTATFAWASTLLIPIQTPTDDLVARSMVVFGLGVIAVIMGWWMWLAYFKPKLKEAREMYPEVSPEPGDLSEISSAGPGDLSGAPKKPAPLKARRVRP